LQVTIQPDEQSEDEETQLEQLVELLQGPLPKSQHISETTNWIATHLLEFKPAGFIGPLNIDFRAQRVSAFHFSEIILVHKKFPHPVTWAEASNTTRGLWEDYTEDLERLIEVIQRLPFHYNQLVFIRELNFKLEEAFGFFDKRRQLEASQAEVTSKTRSGKRSR
jgi:hypothetical protein